MKKIEMKFSEFQRLCFCNSKKLIDKIFLIDNIPYEWIGIGIVELNIDPDPKKHISIIED